MTWTASLLCEFSDAKLYSKGYTLLLRNHSINYLIYSESMN